MESNGRISESSEPLKLTTINDDCKELIFDHLEWPEMLSIADTSKQLYTAVCRVFKRKYSNGKIDFGFPKMGDEFSRTSKFVVPDVLVLDEVTALKMLRNFGHLIVNGSFELPGNNMHDCYFIEYASQSLVQMTLVGSTDSLFHHPLKKPFTNVKSLHLDYCILDRELPFNEIFPNLQSLKLTDNQYKFPRPIVIKMHFSALTNLAFHDTFWFSQNDILDLLQLNPQLESLELTLYRETICCLEFIERFMLYCPNLKHMGLGCKRVESEDNKTISLRQNFVPQNFDHIESLTLNNIDDMSVPYTFGNLQYLTIRSITGSRTDISNFIQKNPRLISLKLEVGNIIELSHFFRIENLLFNIEELNVRIYTEDIPADSLMYFLTQNRSLKRFSLIGRWKNFRLFFNAIISRDTEFKLRNKAIEFIVTRTTDHSSMKYVLRLITKGSNHKTYEEIQAENEQILNFGHFDYDFENRLFECCSYSESPHLMSQKYDEYLNTLRNHLVQYGFDNFHIGDSMSRLYY